MVNDGEGLETWEARKKAIMEKGINGNGTGTLLAIKVLQSQKEETWATPQAHDSQGGKTPEQVAEMRKRTGAGVKNPNEQVNDTQSWSTPQTRDNRSGGADRWENKGERSRNLNDQIAHQTIQNAKLNQNWVCTLMGLPIFWVQP